jgi:hypothetical protein
MRYAVHAAVLSALAILLVTSAFSQEPYGTRTSANFPLASNDPGGPAPRTSVPDRTTSRPSQKGDGQDAYATALAYVTAFYPRWFTHIQSSFAACNQLVGPDHISPIYHVVVAINDDTLYVTTFACVQDQPTIVTVPATKDNYSVLQLDGFGDVFAAIPNLQPGVYGLTGPGWVGDLPPGVIRIPIPYGVSELIFRADKYSPSGQDMTAEAELFRRSLHAASLSDYEANHDAGAAEIVPEANFAAPLKQTADGLVANDTITFLTQLQTAVLDSTTQPLTPSEQMLSDHFNALFMDHNLDPDFIAGAQAAHAALDADYLTHFLPETTWITFTNIGYWDTTPQGYLDRSAIAEYLQYGNNRSTAGYYQTFLDGHGRPLDGSKGGYILTFPKGGQPETNRFWSLTAYLPDSIELVPNDANKYVVGSYTPGLVTNSDGSVSIFMFATQPPGVPQANWLPVPKGQFNVMLRDYGPAGSVLDNTYVPPPVMPAVTVR